jgi:hypothetical protein
MIICFIDRSDCHLFFDHPNAVAGLQDCPDTDSSRSIGYNDVWGGLHCSNPKLMVPSPTARKKAVRENALAFHAHIYNASTLKLLATSPADPSRLLIVKASAYHHQHALKDLRGFLGTFTGKLPDFMILVFTMLCWPAGKQPKSPPRYPESPLAEAQGLRSYSTAPMTPDVLQNIRHLFRFIEARGGIDRVSYNPYIHPLLM